MKKSSLINLVGRVAAGGTFANRLAEVADAKRVKGHFEMPHRVAVSCALALSADSSGGAVHSPDALAGTKLSCASRTGVCTSACCAPLYK